MPLKSLKLDNIFNAIAEGQREHPEAFMTFIAAQTNGAIPIAHVKTYLARDEFKEIDGCLTFAAHISSFEHKTKAFQDVTEDLIASGKMKRVNVTHFQERAVGGNNRLEAPEFKINRAYFRSFGFPADSVFLNVQIEDSGELLLQKRSANVVWPNTLDFAAGGAIKYPETTFHSLRNQSLEEIGLTAENADYLGQANLSFQDIHKEWTTRLAHRLFWTNISPAQMHAANFNTEEVSGYALTSPEEALFMCGNGEFARPNVQSFLTSLMISDNLPAFKGDDELKDILQKTSKSAAQLKI